MTRVANRARGEAMVAGILLRPTFAALVAAEEELGPLFALLERAAAGQLTLSEMETMLWHCRFDAHEELNRDACGEMIAAAGLSQVTPALKILLGQILAGR